MSINDTFGGCKQYTVNVYRGLPGKDGRSFIYRGVWASGIVYSPLDVVAHDDKVWLCNKATSSEEPRASSASWQEVAVKVTESATGESIVQALSALPDNDKLSYNVLKDKPAIPTVPKERTGIDILLM